MAIIKCKMCGGDLDLIQGQTVAECEYCGSRQTVPTADNEKKLTLFARANRLRAACEFDKAAGIYEAIVADFPEEAEAYWGLVLCKYGIEYVDDPSTGKRIPTCHRSSYDSILEDSDFEQAMENADTVALKLYREEAKCIEALRKDIVETSSREAPYDIFICYKETAPDCGRTVDSVLAQDIYDALTARGYRVFFSRITLEDKLGQKYEPYIFAALNSARVMLVVGTAYEHFNAVWVKNEWSRYIKLRANDKDKHLIPCYRDIDAYDMPKEFAQLQAQDLGKVGAIQDLVRNVGKFFTDRDVAASSERNSANDSTLLTRAFMFLKDGDFVKADGYLERVLDISPTNGQAYLGKLMAEHHARTEVALVGALRPLEESLNYAKVQQYCDNATKQRIARYAADVLKRLQQQDTRIRAVRAKKGKVEAEIARVDEVVARAKRRCDALQESIATRTVPLELMRQGIEQKQGYADQVRAKPVVGKSHMLFYFIAALILQALFLVAVFVQEDTIMSIVSFVLINLLCLFSGVVEERNVNFWKAVLSLPLLLIFALAFAAIYGVVGIVLLWIIARDRTYMDIGFVVVNELLYICPLWRILKIAHARGQQKRAILKASKEVDAAVEQYNKKLKQDTELNRLHAEWKDAQAAYQQLLANGRISVQNAYDEYIQEAVGNGMEYERLLPNRYR